MGLGSRGGSRHETAKTAGVNPEDYWAFKPGQSVMTVDGFPGKVTSVLDGPFQGAESYEVTLNNNMGGGLYTEGQLRAFNDVTASHENTASIDYPELAEILAERPDIGKYPHTTMGLHASLQTQAAARHTIPEEDRCGNCDGYGHTTTDGQDYPCGRCGTTGYKKTASNEPGMCEEGHLTWGGNCPSCRNADGDQNHMVINEGDHRPERVQDVKQSSKTAEWWDMGRDPDIFHAGHETLTSPVEGGKHGYRSECNTCGTVLKIHPTEGEAQAHANEHSRTGIPPWETGNADTTHIDKGLGYDEHYNRTDGCTVCGNSEHNTADHSDGNVTHVPTDAWRNRHDPESPYSPYNRDYSSREGSLEHGYALFAEAVRDPSFAFHFTAAWKDVRNKARRIRSEGGVHLTEASTGWVVAQVKGDHGTYESAIMRVPGTQKVGQWDCGCKWAKYHWGAPDDFSRFAGRMCSHVMALNFECQARGMFGREVSTDSGTPPWLTKQDMTRASSLDSIDYAPVHVFAALAVQGGEDLIETLQTLRLVAAVSSPWGEPGPSDVPLPTGGTSPRDPSENPASAGFLTAADPQGWGQQTPADLGDRSAALASAYDESMFEPEIAVQAALDPKEAWAQLLVPLVRAIGPRLIKAAPMLTERLMHKGQDPQEQVPEGEQPQVQPSTMQPVNDFAKGLKSWTDQDANEGKDAINVTKAYSALHDEPEPALPTTDGADDDMMFESDLNSVGDPVGTTYSGYAGDPEPDQKTATFPTAADPGSSGGGLAPGSDMAGDPTSAEPEDMTFATTGSVAGPVGARGTGPCDVGDPGPVGSVADIVANFQATAGANAIMAASGPKGAPADGMDLAAAAREHLQKAAMATFSPAEQQELIREGEGSVTASNLDRLEITGTHYEHLDALGAADEDEDSWMG